MQNMPQGSWSSYFGSSKCISLLVVTWTIMQQTPHFMIQFLTARFVFRGRYLEDAGNISLHDSPSDCRACDPEISFSSLMQESPTITLLFFNMLVRDLEPLGSSACKRDWKVSSMMQNASLHSSLESCSICGAGNF